MSPMTKFPPEGAGLTMIGEPPTVTVAAGGSEGGRKGTVWVPPMMTLVCPPEVCTAMGVPPTVMVWPGFTVVESPMIKFPPDGTGFTTTFDWPAGTVAIGVTTGGEFAFVSAS